MQPLLPSLLEVVGGLVAVAAAVGDAVTDAVGDDVTDAVGDDVTDAVGDDVTGAPSPPSSSQEQCVTGQFAGQLTWHHASMLACPFHAPAALHEAEAASALKLWRSSTPEAAKARSF